MNLKQTVRTRMSDTCIGASMTLRRVTRLELMWYRMRGVIWLQTPTVFWLLNVHGAKDVRQTEIHTYIHTYMHTYIHTYIHTHSKIQKYIHAYILVPEPSDSEVGMAIENLKRHKSPGIDQIPADTT
jgi:hypothetical protein